MHSQTSLPVQGDPTTSPRCPAGVVPRKPRSGVASAGCSPSAVGMLDDVRRALRRDPEGARAAALRLVEFLKVTAAEPPPPLRGGLAPWQQRAVEAFMRKQLDSPVRLRDLARQASLSVSHFSRAFRASFGTTPQQYLTRLRLAHAQKMMLTTAEPLSQIALACGMADQAHFSKFFRRALGESPSAWRRRNGSGTHATAAD